MDPGKYINRMMEAYEQHFGVKPDMKHRFSLQKGDHPALATSPSLNEDDKEIYTNPLLNVVCGIFLSEDSINSQPWCRCHAIGLLPEKVM